jgi:GTP-binding protein HflX
MDSTAIWGGNADRVVLVGVAVGAGESTFDAQDSLDELARLADTYGSAVAARCIQRRERPDAATFIGKGKAAEVARLVGENKATAAVFDADLSPAQQRNLRNILGAPVMDRSMLILEIFARHARSREAKAQVNLARAEYQLSHLAGQWSHLERQRGSLSARAGPGEKQIETDRRIIEQRIGKLKKDLAKIARDRSVRRAPRLEFFQLAVVGYTNAGKSTLFNALTHAGVPVQDKLFATLDSTVRAMGGPFGGTVLVSDTVGFIRKLPARLVASFRSTLEEIVHSDMIVEVVDVSHPRFLEHMEVTGATLRELGVGETPRLHVFNKTDLAAPEQAERAENLFPRGLFVCARDPASVSRLRRELLERIAASYVEDSVELRVSQRRERASVYELAEVLEEKAHGSRLTLRFRTTPRRYGRLREILAGAREEE